MDHFPSPIAFLCGAFCPEITQMDGFMATEHSTAVDTIYNTTRNCSKQGGLQKHYVCNAAKFKSCMYHPAPYRTHWSYKLEIP